MRYKLFFCCVLLTSLWSSEQGLEDFEPNLNSENLALKGRFFLKRQASPPKNEDVCEPIVEETPVDQEESPNPCCRNPCCRKRTKYYPLEFRAGYYYFFDSTLRDVYNDGALDLQLALTVPLFNYAKGQFALYGSGEYVHKSGHSLILHQKTSITLVPLSLALKYSLDLNCLVKWYLMFGPRYVFLWQKNNSSFVDRHVKGNNIGFFGGTGFLVQLPKRFFIDFYAEGSYCKIHPSHRNNVIGPDTQVGGLAAGMGLGRNF